jgi:hypothetical protein
MASHTNQRIRSFADFGISLVYDDYVSTTGMAAAPGGPLSTSVGYSCGVTSFLFRPDVIVNLCYIDRPSFFTGTL